MSFVPEDCVDFHKFWLEGGHENEKIEDLDTTDMIKALIGLHFEMMMTDRNHDENILCLIDRLDKSRGIEQDFHRIRQIQMVKNFIQQGKMTIVEAIFLLFSRNDIIHQQNGCGSS